MKGVMTDVGFSNAVLAQQMYGGHGYIAENGMEQFVRDSAHRHDLRVDANGHSGARPRRTQIAARRAAASRDGLLQ